MCGLSGCFERSGGTVEAGLVERMTDRIDHRGPDDRGIFDGGVVKLGHTRLSLLDLAGGQQPMANHRGDVVVVFNGEIYNFAELRKELIGRGHRFRTRSDTEVIPLAYEEWGPSFVERLRGMFAFALWDARQRRLILARDRLGVKPLYYFLDGERVLFASEIKSILASRRIERRLDPEALHDYLSLLVPLAPQTMFAGVRALEPGSTLTIAAGQVTARRYWEPVMAPDEGLDEATALAGFEARLRETLRDQVVADVPVGAFLSGGIDSSLLVSFLSEGRSDPLETFNIGFDESSHDEAPFARAVADRYRTRHHELRVTRGSAGPDLLGGVLDQFDQPFADSSAIPTWLVSRETRRFVKTVISGDGGDELFGGYTAYRVAAQLARLRRLPSLLRRALVGGAQALGLLPSDGTRELSRRLEKALRIAALSPGEALCALRSYFDEPAKRALYRPEHAARVLGYRTADRFRVVAGDGDLASALAVSDLRHRLAGDMLTKVDMMSMSHGLEVRVPLLDERIVDFALTLPSRLRVRGGITKVLLRRSARARLPRSVVDKPKAGFVIPLHHAAGPAMDRLLDETIARPHPRTEAIFERRTLHRYAAAFRSGRGDPEMSRYQVEQRTYALAALERWAERWNVAL